MWYTQLSAATWLLLEVAVVYAVGLAIYRLYLHPLSKIPGPKHFAVSGLPLAIENKILGLFNRKVLKLHEEYGDIVRTGPNNLAMNGTIGWPEVFGHTRSGQPEFFKWNDFYHLGDKSSSSIFASDREDHRRQRRLMAHAFSNAAIKEQEPLISKYVDLLFAQLRKDAEQQKPTDMHKWYSFTSFDIVGDLVFGEPFNCLENSNYHPWVSTLFNGVKGATQMHALLRMPFLKKILGLMISKEDVQKFAEHNAMSGEKAERRIALGPAPNGRKDIMTYILRHNDEKGMSHGEILKNADALIQAGSETTSSALSGLTYYITTNPQALERVQNEVRAAFSSEEDITISSTAHLQYLQACIEEAMRLYPPVAENPHVFLPVNTCMVTSSPKTFITVHQWAVNHNARNFALPEAFRPERWLSPDHPFYDPQFITDKKSAFEPFSFGPRNCIGKNLAYAELRLVAARLFWNFDFVLQPESHSWPDHQKVYTLWDRVPLMVQLRQVERS